MQPLCFSCLRKRVRIHDRFCSYRCAWVWAMDSTQEYSWCSICQIWGDEHHQEEFHEKKETEDFHTPT